MTSDPPANGVTIRWQPVTTPADVDIVAYQVLVVADDSGLGTAERTVDVTLPPTATHMKVPPQFLTPGATRPKYSPSNAAGTRPSPRLPSRSFSQRPTQHRSNASSVVQRRVRTDPRRLVTARSPSSNWVGIVPGIGHIPAQIPMWEGSRPDPRSHGVRRVVGSPAHVGGRRRRAPRRLCRRRSDAAAAFVRRYQRRVFGLARSIVEERELAEDLAQEAFVRAWRHAASYDRGRGSVESWLLAIARNAALDARRSRRPAGHQVVDGVEQVLHSADDPAQPSSDGTR